MDQDAMEYARRWLAEQGVTQVGDDRWTSAEAPEDGPLTNNEVAHAWAYEARDRVERAFAEVLGNDVGELRAGGRLHELSHEPLLRRTRRVLRNSGPVPWPVKFPVYQAALTQPDLHLALFRGLLNSYHDIYGSLELRPALTLLAKLDLPADTEHLVPLTTVLNAGHTNHYRSPGAWKAATADG
ncbi:hypothetical protein ACIGXA_16330 [Streptomyces fildesensis]|uniref:Uncharacterized protein n=1 Tax=Streptomyces fildesensis TaxID=375757 RepID=A0ABW8C6N1_9ACTN